MISNLTKWLEDTLGMKVIVECPDVIEFYDPILHYYYIVEFDDPVSDKIQTIIGRLHDDLLPSQ